MDRQAFGYLYLHANSMATLGMLRAMVRLTAMPAPTEPTPEMLEFAAGIEQGMADPESFDWSVHDEIDQAVKAAEQERAQGPSANLPFFDECVDMTAPDEVEGEMPDIARYPERAHAARDALAARIDDSFARVDQGVLAAAFATLPAGLPPLTQALTGEQLERWIERYEAGDEGLMQIIEETRRHEPLP
jgi:hypothetical protein